MLSRRQPTTWLYTRNYRCVSAHMRTASTTAAITQPAACSQGAFDLDAESIARGQTGRLDRAGEVAGAAGDRNAAHQSDPSTPASVIQRKIANLSSERRQRRRRRRSAAARRPGRRKPAGNDAPASIPAVHFFTCCTCDQRASYAIIISS